MTLSRQRIRGIVRKELREYVRNRSLILGMAVLPLAFTIQPLVVVLRVTSGAATTLTHEHVLLFLLGIPVLVPVIVAATAVAGERQQGTLEPALSTPIRSEEFLLGKALSAFMPSVVIAYSVFALFLVIVTLLAQPSVASAVLQWPDIVAQLIFTPLLAAWSIWVGIAVSCRSSDARVAQQLALLASLPLVFAVIAIALGAIAPSLELAVGVAAVLIVADLLGWRFVAPLFNRERLITGSK